MLNAQTRLPRQGGLNYFLKATGQAVYMAVASRAVIGTGVSPFAIALFTAGIYSGLDYKWMLLGCVMGFPWERATLAGAGTLIGCLAALGLWFAFSRAKDTRLMQSGWFDGISSQTLISLTALLSCAASGFIGGGSILSRVASALIAQTVAPVVAYASTVNRKRTLLLGEERLAIFTMLVIALFGFAGSPLGFLAGAFAAAVTLVASYAGAAFGTATGAIAGVAVALASGDAGFAASLAVMGLVAGLTLPLGRGWSALAFVMTNSAGMLFGLGHEMGVVEPVSCAAVGLLYAFIREEDVKRIAGWISPNVAAPDLTYLASRIRQSTGSRLLALQKVFETLSEGYGDIPSSDDEQSMIMQMRKALCAGCPNYEKCWNGNDDRARRLLCGLMAETLKGNPMVETDEVPPQIARDCRRAAIIPRKLASILRAFDQDRKRLIQSRAAGTTLAKHFSSARKIISGLNDALDKPLYIDDEMGECAMAALEREGFYDTDVMVLSGERVEVCVTKDEIWLEDDARKAQKALSNALGVSLRAAFSRGGDVSLKLVQSPRISASVGYACRPLTAGAPCGDSYVATALDAGQVLIALSDGMGSGEPAAGESARTVELIRRFLSADIDDALTLDSINQLLLLRNGDEMFATADICVIDLNRAKARFVKQGACSSYILRGKRVEAIEGGRLPLGILDEVRPGVRETSIGAGDMIVMITDGVCDGASDEECLWLGKTLAELSGKDSDAFCRELIKAAGQRPSGVKDDMTAIAVGIGKAGM